MKRPANKLLASAVGVFLIFVLAVAYIVSGVLGTPLTSRPKNVKVDLSSTGGLFVGSEVTYRGVRVGKVTDISFTPTGVQANAELTSSQQIPADTRAQVRSLSPIGEQYLDLQPRDDTGPYLQNNSVISATDTLVPTTLASTVISINKVLSQIDANKLHTVLSESSQAFTGTSSDLQQLTDQGQLLIDDLTKYWPTADRLITNGGTVLDIGTANANAIRTGARNFQLFASFLKSYNPELTRTLDNAPNEVKQIHQIISDARAVVPTFLGVAGNFSGLLAAYEPHLRVLLSEFAPGLGTLARSISNGTLALTLIAQSDHYCDYGTSEQDPKSTTRRPMSTTGGCSPSWPWLQRGAAHAPGPVR